MANFTDITGQTFNFLTVIERLENSEKGRARWRCLCVCGNYTIVTTGNLKNGAVKSCGCLRKTNANRTHGLSHTRHYKKWVSMKRRCYDVNDPHYKNYGARGIRVCDNWKNDFTSFYKWCMETGEREDLTLERLDVNGNYSPSNCSWVDKKTQANNRTTNRIYTYNGKTQNLAQWCEELNLKYGLVHSRIYKHGWSFEKAITTEVITDGYAMRVWKEKKRRKKDGM